MGYLELVFPFYSICFTIKECTLIFEYLGISQCLSLTDFWSSSLMARAHPLYAFILFYCVKLQVLAQHMVCISYIICKEPQPFCNLSPCSQSIWTSVSVSADPVSALDIQKVK